ncbi:uncharacterized protein LOC105702926 [Orussus abietinus]|uniref:uncharacterized protein LOC105702926 n=1 Tax=Orussus abietinus TaxID=222816 RepID=UPI00062510EE|nr:uncharacterized protein LOC105702926 [Orussus abietinus]
MPLIHDLKPFLYVARLVGLAPYSIRDTQLSLSIGGLFCSLLCLTFCGNCFYTRTVATLQLKLEWKLKILTVLRTILSALAISADVVLCVLWTQKMQICIDYILKYDFAIKCKLEDSKGSAFVIRSYIVIVVLFVFFISMGWITAIYERVDSVVTGVMYALLYIILSLSVFKFVAIVCTLLSRFQRLNRLILSDGTTLTSLVAEVGGDRKRLRLRDVWWLHGCLVAAAEELNSLYSVQLFLWFCTLTFNITTRIYVFFEDESSFNFKKFLRDGGIGLYFIMMLTILTAICHRTSTEANKVGTVVFSPGSKIFSSRSAREKEDSFPMAQYFLLHQFHFSAGSGFFRINLQLLLTIAGAMTTYLVILIAPGVC